MPHADTLNLSRRGGGIIYRAGRLGLLTDAGVAAGDTKAGLDSFVDSVSVHADQQFLKARTKKAFRTDEAITDAAIAPLTTVAGLVALTQMGSNSMSTEYHED